MTDLSTDKNLFPCKDCRYHIPLADPRNYACHRLPPVPLVMPDQQHGIVVRAAWPTVGMHDACGAGEPKLEFTLPVGGPTEPIDKTRRN